MRLRVALLQKSVLRGLALLICVIAAPAVSPENQQPEHLFTAEHTAMATRWRLLLYASDTQRSEELSEAVFDEIDRIDDLLSNYNPQSELSRVNRLAGKQQVTTDPETFAFLSAAQYWSRRSQGAFDVTVGPLMKAWGFFRKQGRLPTDTELGQLRSSVGYRNVELTPSTRGVRFRSPGVELDPGGIGKGFAVDAALRLLRAEGVQAAMLSAGSSTIGAIGVPTGVQGWRVVSHDPWHPEQAVSSVLLRNATLSTANCAEKNFVLAGHRYCHIMDPHTLRPVEVTQQVTILDPSGTSSDSLSNALFVLRPDASVRLLKSMPQDRALIVTGSEDHRVCTAIRWPEPIAPGFCEHVDRVQ